MRREGEAAVVAVGKVVVGQVAVERHERGVRLFAVVNHHGDRAVPIDSFDVLPAEGPVDDVVFVQRFLDLAGNVPIAFRPFFVAVHFVEDPGEGLERVPDADVGAGMVIAQGAAVGDVTATGTAKRRPSFAMR